VIRAVTNEDSWFRPGVFSLSDNAGNINNFNDARGPLSYTAVFKIVSCLPDSQRTPCIWYFPM